MVAFDLLELDGDDLRRQPIEERRTRLADRSGRANIKNGMGSNP